MIARPVALLAATLSMVSLVSAVSAVMLAAQAPVRAPIRPRPIAAPDARSASIFGDPSAVRPLRDGALLINDTRRHQVLRLDSTLSHVAIVADSSAGADHSYGARAGGLIPYAADTTLFVDPVGLSMLVIDPSGAVARVASIPRSQDAPALVSPSDPALGDAAGRIVYRAPVPLPTSIMQGVTNGETPDSLPVLRLDVKTRRLDTAGFVRVPKVKMSVTRTEKGMSLTGIVNPVEMTDVWSVFRDGTIALIRGLDYRVELIPGDGTRRVGPKIPFPWRPLDDDAKAALIDSVTAIMKNPQSSPAGVAAMMMAHGAPASSHAGGAGIQATIKLAPASELPDYLPAFGQGSALADVDDHLWIRTSTEGSGAFAGGAIYDVIDRSGALIDRVQVPPGRRVVGFGPSERVYLAARDGANVWLERTHR